MNPAFVVIVAIALFAVWFLASGAYKPLGKFIGKIYKDAVDELTEEEEKDKQ